MSTYTHKMVVALCIDKNFVLKRVSVCKCQNTLCIPTIISVFNQPFLLLVCMFHFFIHSQLSLPFCIFFLPGSWVLIWEFFLKKRISQFYPFLVSLNPWVWRFLNAPENECSFVFWWGNFADSKQEPKRNNQCVQVPVNKFVKKKWLQLV
jgi:hypothetical protein